MARVLVVESDSEAANALTQSLQTGGHRVRVADAGEGAPEIAGSFRADIVVIARRLSDIDGLRLLRRFKERPATTSTPVLMMIGQEDAGDVATACALGAADVATYPAAHRDARTLAEKLLRVAGETCRTWQEEAWRPSIAREVNAAAA
jgi:two-component system OmpR family response regulator